MKIRLVMLGKTRRAEIRALLEDYLGRIRHYAKIETIELRDPSAALRASPSASPFDRASSRPAGRDAIPKHRGAQGKRGPAPSGAGRGGLRQLELGPAATWVLLDAGGKQLTSEQFACWLGELRDRGTRELVFLCGDAQGFPDELRQKAHTKLSLSSLTLAHELARVVLAEQLYRAFAILAGHPYPK